MLVLCCPSRSANYHACARGVDGYVSSLWGAPLPPVDFVHTQKMGNGFFPCYSLRSIARRCDSSRPWRGFRLKRAPCPTAASFWFPIRSRGSSRVCAVGTACAILLAQKTVQSAAWPCESASPATPGWNGAIRGGPRSGLELVNRSLRV